MKRRHGHYWCDRCDEPAFGERCERCHQPARLVVDQPLRTFASPRKLKPVPTEEANAWFVRMRQALNNQGASK